MGHPPKDFYHEISRALVLNLSLAAKKRCLALPGTLLSLTPPSFLSRGTQFIYEVGEVGHPPEIPEDKKGAPSGGGHGGGMGDMY